MNADAFAKAHGLDRVLSMELVRVTENAAVAAAGLRGRGDEQTADRVAARAMAREMARLAIRGRIVVGEGDEASAEQLYVGQDIGTGNGPEVDIALDALEGATVCAKDLPGAFSVIALAEPGSLLKVPAVYMDKIAIGPGYPDGIVDLDATPVENLETLAAAKGVAVSALTVCILDRPRHGGLIEAVRGTGAAIRLIADGDVAAIIHAANPDESGIDIYLGSGSAPAGVLAAAALRCTGGQMQGRLRLDNADDHARARSLGIADLRRKYSASEMAAGDVVFAATGVTDGTLLSGVRFARDAVDTDTLVLCSSSRTQRSIKARHAAPERS